MYASEQAIFKRLTVRLYTAHHGQGWPGFHAVAMFLQKVIRRETKATLLNLLRMNIPVSAHLLFGDYILSK